MRKLIFATHNTHKLTEIRQILPEWEILGLTDIGLHDEIIENGQTLEANAEIKADYVYRKTGVSCFADDTGLEVEALNGAPGVHSARYATNGHDFKANMDKLLKEMTGIDKRGARFRTSVCLILNDEKHFFEGIVYGQIITVPRGDEGFGYDPVFVPDGYTKTFAEMDAEEKNSISHRGMAVSKLQDFLLNLLLY